MKRTNWLRLPLLCLIPVAGIAQNSAIPKPPDTPKHPVFDEYHGVKVADDYRWLENWDDPAVKQWSAAQNARTREYLDHAPSRSAIEDRLKQLITTGSTSYYDLQFRAGMLFAMKDQPPLEQPLLVALRSADDPDSAEVVFDPNAASASGSIAVDFFVPSFDGKYVAVALSEGGSEDSSAHVFEVATGKELADAVPRVNYATAGGSIDWKGDNSGFYYTRYPQGKERPPEDANFYQQVYFHKLGTRSSEDTYVIGKDFPRIAEIELSTSDDGRWLLASVSNGDGGQFAHYIMNADGHWTQLTHFEDGIVSAKFGSDAALYLLSRKGAPRGRILRLPLDRLNLAQAKVVVPQTSGTGPDERDRASIEFFQPAQGRLCVVDVIGGPSRVRVFDYTGRALPAPSLPPVPSVDRVIPVGADMLIDASTFTDPPAWYHFDSASGKVTRTALFETSPAKFDDAEVIREFATSKDGTRVPLTIIRRKGTRLDGANPVLLTAYGGYGVINKPFFNLFRYDPGARLWLDGGGIFVKASPRGGGDYGREWHEAGNLTHKQNTFDDFLACAQYLIDRKYTSSAHLAILGASMGGVLMGAALTQRPDLFRAVVADSGWYDMLRWELDSNGEFNTTELGTVKDPDQFKALYAYSPYHRVKDGTVYPAIYMPIGENDHRVNPMQSRKMIARLQAANRSGNPILFRAYSNAGHGYGSALDELLLEDTDTFTFLFDQLSIELRPVQK